MDRDTAAPEFLTTREVAALLRVKERKVYDLAAAGDIPCRRVTGKLLFPKAQIEAWLSGSQPVTVMVTPVPDMVSGSHDPLLDWALRESGSGLASFFDGSLDGLGRLANGEATACGMHVFEPDTGGWNSAHVEARLADAPVVLIEWAKRTRGLILAPALEGQITGIAGLKGRKVALRQPKAGGQILFDHMLAEAGLTRADINPVAAPARTEADAAAAVASGQADAALGLEAMARQFRLGFLPLVTERYDIAILRHAYFGPRWQVLAGFCRTSAFTAKAAELGGYDLVEYGRVHWNGP
jgi:putative molybdopterin biosynthesis protein